MFKAFLTGIVFTIAAAIVAAYILLRVGAVPANADARPGRLERWAAHTSLTATLRREAPTGQGPIAPTPDNLVRGVHLYARHCAVCHGTAAGYASASAIAKGEYPAPPQLGGDGVEDDPVGWTYWKISHGIRWTGMPSWKDELTERQRWTLAVFLKHMDKLPPPAEKAWQQVRHTWPAPPASATGQAHRTRASGARPAPA